MKVHWTNTAGGHVHAIALLHTDIEDIGQQLKTKEMENAGSDLMDRANYCQK